MSERVSTASAVFIYPDHGQPKKDPLAFRLAGFAFRPR
jgi:hypothetical protein